MTILTLVALAATSATAQGEWAYKTPIPTPRAYVTSCVLDNQIYVIGGGLTREEGSAAVERYDPETDTWDVTIAGLPVPHFAPASAVVNGKIYVMGGKVNYYSTEDYATDYNLLRIEPARPHQPPGIRPAWTRSGPAGGRLPGRRRIYRRLERPGDAGRGLRVSIEDE
jgi:hypothetical protein